MKINVTREELLIRIEQAKNLAFECGGTDGAHHKDWIIDQMVRILCGDEDVYDHFVYEFNSGPDGPNTYEWSEGIPP